MVIWFFILKMCQFERVTLGRCPELVEGGVESCHFERSREARTLSVRAESRTVTSSLCPERSRRVVEGGVENCHLERSRETRTVK